MLVTTYLCSWDIEHLTTGMKRVVLELGCGIEASNRIAAIQLISSIVLSKTS